VDIYFGVGLKGHATQAFKFALHYLIKQAQQRTPNNLCCGLIAG